MSFLLTILFPRIFLRHFPINNFAVTFFACHNVPAVVLDIHVTIMVLTVNASVAVFAICFSIHSCSPSSSSSGRIAIKPEMNGNLEHMIRASAMVIQMIDDAPTVNALNCSEIPNNWIPCSVQLPEDDTEVLVYLFENNKSPYIAWLSDGRWYTGYFEVEREDEPVAWMPLPEPYQERGEQ